MIDIVVIKVIMACVLLSIMFSVGLVLTAQDFKRVALMPLTVALGLFAQMFLLPLLAYIAIRGLGLETAAAIGILLMAICPGGPVSNFFSYVSGGDAALALTLTVTNTLLCLASIPAFFIWTFLGAHAGGVDVPTLYIIKTLLIQVIAPTALGMIVRAYKPGFAAAAAKYTEKAGMALIMVMLCIIMVNNRAVFKDSAALLLAAVIFVNVGGMIVGYLWAALFRRSRDVRKTFSFEVGLQNIPLATVLSLGMFASDERQLAIVMAVVGLYAIISVVSAVCGIFVFKKYLPTAAAAAEAR